MFQRVICPLDGSELSERALPYAAEIAARFDAPLVLLRAYDGPERAARLVAMSSAAEPLGGMITAETITAVEDAAEEQETEIHQYLADHMRRLKQRALDVKGYVVDGAPVDAILQEAEREPDSVVVISTHGRGGLGRLVFGSVAQDVISKCGSPVLLIRLREDS